MPIRAAHPSEFTLLQAVEDASGEVFRTIGMPEIADDDPMPLEAMRHAHVWVADEAGPVAWVAALEVDGQAHVEQLSVHPDHARRGIGAALLDHVAAWAAERGLAGLTLTTFRDVPWNGPYYRRLGFAPVTALSPGLAEIVAAETARGLDPDAREVLRRGV
ncbi:GNAT family N-acetyltransferase [Actinosynnema sp. NPDC020468]|uniref:GNAT family N-acetyltransferase n=1 Tax=Actinosynnema sp. NPDC020468 TaxID=3154488 RepID=UPI00340731D6